MSIREQLDGMAKGATVEINGRRVSRFASALDRWSVDGSAWMTIDDTCIHLGSAPEPRPPDYIITLTLAREQAHREVTDPRERAIIVRHIEDALCRAWAAGLLPVLPISVTRAAGG